MPKGRFPLVSKLAERAGGPASIETDAVMHDREGDPESVIVIGRLADGRRFIANPEPDRHALEVMTKSEMVDARGMVRHDDAAGRNVFAI